MKQHPRATLALSLLAISLTAHADPPRLQSRFPAQGMRIEGCQGDVCTTWAQFPSQPRRTLVDARVSPSGRHFFVWSQPARGARELDVFTAPARPGTPGRSVGHWSPGAGGTLEWTEGDRLWHVAGCGTACQTVTFYEASGRVISRDTTMAAERSPDARFAVMVTGNDTGALLDAARNVRQGFRGPPGGSFGGQVRWVSGGAAVRFTRADGGEQWVRVSVP